jgi:ribonuclease HI
MELTATIKALEYISTKDKIQIYTDSKYVKQGITEWITKWKINGWKTSKKEEVKNKDLWLELDNLTSKNSIEWVWVKAHSDNDLNNEVDLLARKEAGL